jgi:hypothetical protein
MTCIVGAIDYENNRVIIGGDAAAVSGLNVKSVRQPKVFKKGDFIFGCTTSFRMMQLIQYQMTTFENIEVSNSSILKHNTAEFDLYGFMCTTFVDELRKCFKNGGFSKIMNGEEEGGVFLVGYKNRLFVIYGDYQVSEPLDGFYAVGCGDKYALGAIKSLYSDECDVQDILLKSLEISVHFSGGVRGPFTFVNT